MSPQRSCQQLPPVTQLPSKALGMLFKQTNTFYVLQPYSPDQAEMTNNLRNGTHNNHSQNF